jgi:hypothetical protein
MGRRTTAKRVMTPAGNTTIANIRIDWHAERKIVVEATRTTRMPT